MSTNYKKTRKNSFRFFLFQKVLSLTQKVEPYLNIFVVATHCYFLLNYFHFSLLISSIYLACIQKSGSLLVSRLPDKWFNVLHHQVMLSFTIHSYDPFLLVGLLDCIQCLHRDDIFKTSMVSQHSHVHYISTSRTQDLSKSFKPYPENKAIAEHFC